VRRMRIAPSTSTFDSAACLTAWLRCLTQFYAAWTLGANRSLVIPPPDDGPRARIHDVVRPSPLEAGVLQFVVDVPAVRLQHQSNAIEGQIAVCRGCVSLRDAQGFLS